MNTQTIVYAYFKGKNSALGQNSNTGLQLYPLVLYLLSRPDKLLHVAHGFMGGSQKKL